MSNKRKIEQLEASTKNLPAKDHGFAKSLCSQYAQKGQLSSKQWYWVDKLIESASKTSDTNPNGPHAVEVGDASELFAMVHQALSHMAYPRISLQLVSGRKLTLKVAKFPEGPRLNVFEKTIHGHCNYGRIGQDGSGWVSTGTPNREEVIAVLEELVAAPKEMLAVYGRMTGVCCFCKSELSDDKSLEAGYGPVCAKHWGLPWGVAKMQPVCETVA